jgi:hypothetical protein
MKKAVTAIAAVPSPLVVVGTRGGTVQDDGPGGWHFVDMGAVFIVDPITVTFGEIQHDRLGLLAPTNLDVEVPTLHQPA